MLPGLLLIKLLSRHILPPLVAIVLIADVILILQFIWKYIDELAGKELPVLELLKMLSFAGLSMLPLALPIGILIGTTIGVGGMAERNELMALKASGVSFFQILYPITLLGIITSILLIIYSNNILPAVNFRFYLMLLKTRTQHPELLLPEGVFSQEIEGYAIFVREKERQGSHLNLSDIIIYEQGPAGHIQGVLIAERGILTSADNHASITLEKGKYYFTPSDNWSTPRKENLISISFNRWTKYIMLNELGLRELTIKLLQTHQEMMDFKTLLRTADSLYRVSFYNWKGKRHLLSQIIPFLDSSFVQILMAQHNQSFDQSELNLDALTPAEHTLFNHYLQSLTSITYIIEQSKKSYQYLSTRYLISLHKRLVFSTACIILAVAGTAIGSIIRKGGLGLPLVTGGIVFALFHVIYMTGEQMAKESIVPVWVATWLPNVVFTVAIIPVVYLVQRDMLKILWVRLKVLIGSFKQRFETLD